MEVVSESVLSTHGTYCLKQVTYDDDPPTTLVSAYTVDGDHYIGPQALAESLAERGIVPELSAPNHGVCSIGFCEADQKWYGWSHRAIYGFGIGHVTAEGDCGVPELVPVGFECRTLLDCRYAAVAFAKSVS